LGFILMSLSFSPLFTLAGLLLTGLGFAPVFPCSIHATPDRFDRRLSADIIGFQMAFSGLGFIIFQPVFGFAAAAAGFAITPYVLIGAGIILFFLTESVNLNTAQNGMPVLPPQDEDEISAEADV
ncbi:MAG: hypothetical protein ACRCUT_11835, partial [Spirochaetota bacterium]